MRETFKSCTLCDEALNEHPQEHITFLEQSACVDQEIAPLIKYLWEAKVETGFSCIGTPCPSYCDDDNCIVNYAYITLWGSESLEKAMAAIEKLPLKKNTLLLNSVKGVGTGYRLVKESSELFSTPKRYPSRWRFEMDEPIESLDSSLVEKVIEGKVIPERKLKSYRWTIRIPYEDLQIINEMILGMTPKKEVILQSKEINGEIALTGAFYREGDIIKGFGEYEGKEEFNETLVKQRVRELFKDNSSLDGEKEELYFEEAKMYHKYLIKNIKSNQLSLDNLLFDEKDSNLLRLTDQNALSLEELANLEYIY